MVKHVFITGGSGFLGINLIRYLLKKKYRVISYDLVPFDYSDCKGKITSIVGDIRDEKLLQKSMKGADIVIHSVTKYIGGAKDCVGRFPFFDY